MPRKINVINLDPLKEDVQPEVSNEIKVEFDDFTKIKNEVINNSDDDTNEVAEVVEVKKQPKKRAVKKKVPVVEEVEDIKPVEEVKPIEEVVEVVEVEQLTKVSSGTPKGVEPKNIKTLELVNCDKCGKQMTKNTLRYHHDKNCPGLKVDKETLPVKKRTVKQTTNEQANDTVINIPKEVIENEVKKRIENTYKDRINERLRVKQEKMQKLATQIA
jgi:hypothetical protein